MDRWSFQLAESAALVYLRLPFGTGFDEETQAVELQAEQEKRISPSLVCRGRLLEFAESNTL